MFSTMFIKDVYILKSNEFNLTPIMTFNGFIALRQISPVWPGTFEFIMKNHSWQQGAVRPAAGSS